MNEKLIRLGSARHLVAVLSSPSADDKVPARKTALILVNSGLIHRVGPFRLHVGLARQLAKSGVTSVRIDLSGKGDSERRKGSDYHTSVICDLKETMDQVEEITGISRFVIFGICTGAENAYQIAFADDRVTGIIPVDGYCYPTLKSRSMRLMKACCNPNNWRNPLRF